MAQEYIETFKGTILGEKAIDVARIERVGVKDRYRWILWRLFPFWNSTLANDLIDLRENRQILR